MELVFRALADPTRRALLDELFAQDGQTLVAPHARFPMTRIAVAKHLGLLEEAGLVVSRRRGREKLHFLNPVPIRTVHDRWVSKYTEGWAAGLVDLKQELEKRMEKVFEIYIRTTPKRLWAAITDADGQLYGGWPMILSGLKTWLETGQELTTPGSLMYASPVTGDQA